MRMERGLGFGLFSPGWRGDITMRGWRYVLMALGVFVWAMRSSWWWKGGVLGARTSWCSSPVGCGGDVHDTRHIRACVDVGKSREVLEEDLGDC